MGCKKLLKFIKQLDSKVAQIQVELIEMQQQIENVVCDVLEKKYNITLQYITPKWSDIVTKAVDERFDQVKSDVEQIQKVVVVSKKEMEEKIDKKNRENNIVIYNGSHLIIKLSGLIQK